MHSVKLIIDFVVLNYISKFVKKLEPNFEKIKNQYDTSFWALKFQKIPT